jgi:hypothetical protein
MSESLVVRTLAGDSTLGTKVVGSGRGGSSSAMGVTTTSGSEWGSLTVVAAGAGCRVELGPYSSMGSVSAVT